MGNSFRDKCCIIAIKIILVLMIIIGLLEYYYCLPGKERRSIEHRLNEIRPATNYHEKFFFKFLVMHQLEFPEFKAERLWAWFLTQDNHNQVELTLLGPAEAEKIRRRQQRPVKDE